MTLPLINIVFPACVTSPCWLAYFELKEKKKKEKDVFFNNGCIWQEKANTARKGRRIKKKYIQYSITQFLEAGHLEYLSEKGGNFLSLQIVESRISEQKFLFSLNGFILF